MLSVAKDAPDSKEVSTLFLGMQIARGYADKVAHCGNAAKGYYKIIIQVYLVGSF